MDQEMNRRVFLQMTAAGGAVCMGGKGGLAFTAGQGESRIVSPGCRGSKVKVARIYMGTSHGLWPKPGLDLKKEIAFYKTKFNELKDDLHGVEFVLNELVTSPGQIARLKDTLKGVDGILAIHLNIGIGSILRELLSAGKPTAVFAAPYSGHGWVGFGALQKEELGAMMECFLTSDYSRLAAAVRPFRAIHHLREAKILNLTTRDISEYAEQMKEKFGTRIERIGLEQVLSAYNAVSDSDAKAETDRWIQEAEKVVEPSTEEIFKSCKLALALENVLNEENATVMTIDCYGTMWNKTIMLPAYPCVGFTRLNNIGLGGICESDMQSAMTHILYQGLTGRPGFISDPTMDESKAAIILPHCLGTSKMDGPDKPADPYKLRDVMERREGAVPQVTMRVGEKVTQSKLIGSDLLLYFTGRIIEAPVSLDSDRGCRTQITVKVDGDVRKLWQNWTNGLHRQTCYGDITRDLERFCRYMRIEMKNEAV